MVECRHFNLFFLCRGISNQGLKHEHGKRRLSRDLMVSKDVLSLKTREGRLFVVLVPCKSLLLSRYELIERLISYWWLLYSCKSFFLKEVRHG